ncbi:hypothetical protein SH2C18_36570 [Clostridium sediminicola]|uniref:sensor histidine kinase n=1 Tax=Clostridium sediminicola TaxID=3114879 RepID=UPI0031F258CA
MDLFKIIYFYAFAIIGYALSTISFYKVINCFVDVKEKKIFKVIAFVGLSSVVTVIIYVDDMVNVSYALIGFITIMVMCYVGSIIKKISVVMVLYPIVVSINFLFKKINLIEAKQNYILWIFLLAIFWLFVYKIMKRKILYAKQYINDKTWVLIDIICFAPFISIILTIVWTRHNEQYKAYLIAVVCIISNIGVMFLIKYIVESVRIRLVNQNYKLQYDYYKSLEEKQVKIRKIYHDMNNNLQLVKTFINNKDIEEAKLFFEKLIKKSTSHGSKTFCKNGIVNAVLNNKYDLMVQNKINTNINISIDNISIDDMDICSIFANTLDNAIEASLKIEDISKRKITIKARTSKGYFSYSISNQKINDVLVEKGSIISSKQAKETHGYGLQNVRDIVNKYNGTIDINYNSEEFSLVMIIKT